VIVQHVQSSVRHLTAIPAYSVCGRSVRHGTGSKSLDVPTVLLYIHSLHSSCFRGIALSLVRYKLQMSSD